MFFCPKKTVSSVSSVWKIPSKYAEHYVLLSELSSHTELTELHRNLLRTTSAKVRAVCVKQSTPHGSVYSVYSVWKIPSKDAEHYVLLFFCQNYRPTEIRVLQTPRKSAPSAWNKKCPLMVPNTSCPLRLCVRTKICSYVLLSKKNLWVPLSSVWKFKYVLPVKNKAPPRFNNFHYPSNSSPKSKSHASTLSLFFANLGSGC